MFQILTNGVYYSNSQLNGEPSDGKSSGCAFFHPKNFPGIQILPCIMYALHFLGQYGGAQLCENAKAH
jgi:hypothetical protein